jgi:DNA-binding beta-propeller fold protein YncE
MNKRNAVALGAMLLASFACIAFSWWWFRMRPAPTRPVSPAGKEALPPEVRLDDVGPRVVSNQTAQPLALYGKGFSAAQRLWVGPPYGLDLPLTVVDERHAYVRLPALSVGPAGQTQTVELKLQEAGVKHVRGTKLTVVDDARFPDPFGLATSRDGKHVFAISQTSDALYVRETAGGQMQALAVADGPRAIAPWHDGKRDLIVVGYAFAPRLDIFLAEGPKEQGRRVVPGVEGVTALAIDSKRHLAFVAEEIGDSVVAIDLQSGERRWRTPVRPNPGALAVAGTVVAVGSQQSGEVELLDVESGEVKGRVAPTPKTAILGGGTEKYSQYVMGGSAPRALVYSSRLDVIFVSSIGPNIGPNPDRMEVSMNGGVGVVSLKEQRFVRHLGFGAGVTEGLALDEASGLLYASDIALGKVRVLDARALAASDASARGALLQEVAIAPPQDFPLARKASDYGIENRAGVELHSGPRALALTADGKRLFVLSRFTGMLAELDVSGARAKKATVRGQVEVVTTRTNEIRRIGQVLFFTDFGRTAMSCDACHGEGHTGGLLFEKTQPLRLYRSPTLRGILQTPPYFNPPSAKNLAETAQLVGGRNRFHRSDLIDSEVEALALYTGAIAPRPNPYVGKDGAPMESVTLPDGKTGNARKGLALFEGKAACATCHPGPHFTTDQDAATRGKLADVGTPKLFDLRKELQVAVETGVGTPSLLGAWDNFPLLTTGSVGLKADEAGQLQVTTRFPLRELLERHGAPPHGNAAALDEGERNDLLAYLLSL